MKTLLLLRHAKSSWKQADLADHDRPLNKRGKQTAPRMGALLREEDLVPDLILCSSAMRAHKTALLAAEACSYTGEIQQTRQLYHAEPQDFIEVLRQAAEENIRVLVVGHNPGLEMLVEELTGEAEVMPTAALAHIELSLERWSDLDLETECRLVKVWRPGELE
ncbi:MAG TPA: histidine phosphatase family protein [Anaerolineales bacterium]|nr:histidine phosphatase family protein [Anaerolineales bacterium]